MKPVQLILCLLAGFLGFSIQVTAQPTRVWQRIYDYPYSAGERLSRLSANRLLGVGGSQMGNSDTVDYAARLWFYNNHGDTIRTIAHLRSRQIASQRLFPAIFGYRAAVRTRDGEFLLNGFRLRGVVSGAVVPAASFLSRIDSLGVVRWTRYYTFNGEPADGQLIGLPDNGALALGSIARPVTSSIFAPVAVLSCFDSLGNVGRQRIIGRTYSTVSKVAVLPDGTYALAGNEERQVPGSAYVRADGWLLRLTASGDTLGGRYFGNAAEIEYWQDVCAAPRNGLLLTGGASPSTTRIQGWLMELDSLGQVRWQQRIPASFGPTTPNYELLHGRALQNGDVLVSGYRLLPGSLTQTQDTYQAVYRPNATGGATVVWERIIPVSAGEPFAGSLDLSAAGELTITGYGPLPSGASYQPLSHLRLQLSERPYVPDLCQTPPTATVGFAPTAGGDSLRFVGLLTPGPRYAQLVRWRWDFGDGTSFDGPAPPPHRFAPGAGAATAVRLTVTNNLGCTATAVAFPFALATATQRALQAQLSVFPNPATGGTGAATVQLPGLRAQPPVAAELLNALGQAVRRERWAPARLAQGAPLDLAGLAPGVYALRLHAAEGTLVKRVVVQ